MQAPILLEEYNDDHITMYLQKSAGSNFQEKRQRTTSLHRERSSAKTVDLSGPVQGCRKHKNVI